MAHWSIAARLRVQWLPAARPATWWAFGLVAVLGGVIFLFPDLRSSVVRTIRGDSAHHTIQPHVDDYPRGAVWSRPNDSGRHWWVVERTQALSFPIAWPEPFRLVMAEALACGTPVLALRAGSVPEVVADGLTGSSATMNTS